MSPKSKTPKTDILESYFGDMPGEVRKMELKLAEAKRLHSLQSQNYIALCHAISGDGTTAGNSDPFEAINSLRAELLKSQAECAGMKEILKVYLNRALSQLSCDSRTGDASEIELLRKALSSTSGDELLRDKKRLDWLQSGHCVLCLVKFKDNTVNDETNGYEFEIDGHQGAPRDQDVRTAIDQAIAAKEKK